ncbi:DUF4822 domain-containing protein [Glutamicibacter mishrai]|uniref:DUF4822 domain-containing protein n=1 Tax=Glutamicibacter mishrai TaxID=1775880 RepID=UPI0020CD32E4|nr:DUF4822 domain-containing protein [Glutamicibacter mishrai]UTT39453.1 DUF4822 domain-containing protein [Glutamicibacter mishrai]
MKKLSNTPKLLMSLGGASLAIGLLAGCTAGAEAGQANAGTTAEASQSVSASTETMPPSEILPSTAWETTGATDAKGETVQLSDKDVSNFVGNAYFHADGTFDMYNLDDSPKMQGDWTVTEDGKTRSIVAKDDAGKVLFTRDSDIVTLTDEEFTYRVFPDPQKTDVYFDIIHTPTDHAEPSAP